MDSPRPSDYEPAADASPRLVAARKAAIRAAFNYRWTHSWYGEPHIADDATVERCYEAFEQHGAWNEIVVAADAVVAFMLQNITTRDI